MFARSYRLWLLADRLPGQLFYYDRWAGNGMSRTRTLVGAAGGVGTTRLAVECGATLARTGRDVAAVDAELGAALYERELNVPGRLALCPARAPRSHTTR